MKNLMAICLVGKNRYLKDIFMMMPIKHYQKWQFKLKNESLIKCLQN